MGKMPRKLNANTLGERVFLESCSSPFKVERLEQVMN